MEVSSTSKLPMSHRLITFHQLPLNYRCPVYPCTMVWPDRMEEAQPQSLRYYDIQVTPNPTPKTLVHATYLIASQFTVRNDVTQSHLLSVTFVWHSSVCIPPTSCKSMTGDSPSTRTITQCTYFFWQLSSVSSRRHSAARAGGRMRALCQYDKRADRKLLQTVVR